MTDNYSITFVTLPVTRSPTASLDQSLTSPLSLIQAMSDCLTKYEKNLDLLLLPCIAWYLDTIARNIL